MSYHQITAAERYTPGLLRRQGLRDAAIGRVTGRHRSTIGREVRRNRIRYDGAIARRSPDASVATRNPRSATGGSIAASGLIVPRAAP